LAKMASRILLDLFQGYKLLRIFLAGQQLATAIQLLRSLGYALPLFLNVRKRHTHPATDETHGRRPIKISCPLEVNVATQCRNQPRLACDKPAAAQANTEQRLFLFLGWRTWV
jgi:hypothetical protein